MTAYRDDLAAAIARAEAAERRVKELEVEKVRTPKPPNEALRWRRFLCFLGAHVYLGSLSHCAACGAYNDPTVTICERGTEGRLKSVEEARARAREIGCMEVKR